jgi:hypothetical protein
MSTIKLKLVESERYILCIYINKANWYYMGGTLFQISIMFNYSCIGWLNIITYYKFKSKC